MRLRTDIQYVFIKRARVVELSIADDALKHREINWWLEFWREDIKLLGQASYRHRLVTLANVFMETTL